MSYCTTCRNGQMKTGFTSVTFDKDNVVIVFRQVPALVCEVCGDYTIEGNIAKSLLQTAREERAKGHEISIMHYGKAA